ncbi:MAG TPA: class II aldolase/adducin family protein [Candidatus Limnocylindrales bacterium]|nr:class II aldolase/adducin family protein [Candidatus Limnocylindrales bacterium]
MDESTLRFALAAAGRRLGARGLISAGEGNLSVRLGEDSLLMTPSGARKDELSIDDLLVVPLVSPTSEAFPPGKPRPSSDIAIHRAAYAARADVQAVVHAHLPASMALTLAGEVPDPQALPETAHFIPRLPYLPFRTMGSTQLAADVAAALSNGEEPLPGAVLLERHGAVAVGWTLDQAVNRLELVEVLCRTWRDAMLIRAARRTD